MRREIALADLIFVAFQLLGAWSASAQNIQTVAGGGEYMNSPALRVSLNGPAGVAYATNGTIFVIEGNRVDQLNPSTGLITTVAGSEFAGYSGNGGSATSAALNFPNGVAVDGAGNLYISDTNNQVIRMVNATTGIISTIAGDGSSGYSGDGGTATGAALSYPYGLAVDGAGNLYIADSGNNRIRMVNAATGIIKTVAGSVFYGYSGDYGPATNASLYNPNGVVVDRAGNLYIADSDNGRIRMVSATSGIITTVAGNGRYGYSGDGGPATNAALNFPYGVALDGAGNLYIDDTYAQRIRLVVASTGIITTVAGNGTYGYSGDGGPATSAALASPLGVAVDGAGNVYIADTSNQRVRTVSASTELISTVAGNGSIAYAGDGGPAASAELNGPYGVAADGAGDIYIADTNNQVIRMVSAATGTISTVAGTGTYGYSGDGGPAANAELAYPTGAAADAMGNLYIADQVNQRIRMISSTTGIISTVAGTGKYGYSGDGAPATSAELFFPTGVTVDGAGDLYIADTNNNVIRMVSAATGIISTVAGNGIDGYSGDGGPATSAEFSYPTAVAMDSAGDLYIADQVNQRIRKISAPTGIISTVAGNGTYGYSGDGGPATSAELSYPTGVVTDGGGNLYIADQVNQRIRMVSAATGIISTVAGNGIYGYSGDGGLAVSAELGDPTGVAVGPTGSLYIADNENNLVRAVTGLAVATSPPFVTPIVTGTLGKSGWYTSNVQVSWAVTDATSPIAYQIGCGPTVISVDTPGKTLTCRATSAGGGAAAQSVTIKRDATPPTISVTAPTMGATYTIGSSIAAAYSCADAVSGIASCMGTVAPGVPIGTAGAGGNTFTVTATDLAGNVAQSTIGYNVALALQIITFGAIAPQTAGTTLALQGSASSGLPVTFASSTPNVCTVSGNMVSLINPGTCSITASQSGNASYSAASPVSRSFSVTPAPVTLTGNCSGGTHYRIAYQCVVSVRAATITPPTGNITYSLDGAPATYVALSSGCASFTVGTLPATGAHRLTIAYPAQGSYGGATNLTESFTTAPGQTQLLVSPSSFYPAAGSRITLTVTASTPQSGVPTGSVDVLDNGKSLGAATIGSNGIATYTVTKISKGTHSYAARYAATTNYAAAVSGSAAVTAH